MINFRFGLSERLFSAAMSLPAELILANQNLLFQFTFCKNNSIFYRRLQDFVASFCDGSITFFHNFNINNGLPAGERIRTITEGI